jgi:hypothetical protein
LQRIVESLAIGRRRRQELAFPLGCLADSELAAQLLRRRDRKLVKLMECCTMRLDSAFARDAKLPYHLDDAGGRRGVGDHEDDDEFAGTLTVVAEV